ncbi:hypothetical protein FE810_02380 [Thalassotalea litorea]|uniref:DUF2059 domain-containing protein n=1 Tax=Thalassotalea litorea TaxID=2020715 RepID=A0A5R9IPF1_9GAMM|nr:hypothetical protein [Thalassotalea litorea]TLU67152.1 hypothetical protein FE810_02380 [Thalassotalea litorea]
MKNILIALLSLSLLSCASISSKRLDSSEQFERLYSALGMEEIIASFDVVEIDNSEIVLRSFTHLPEEIQKAMATAISQKTVLNDPVNKEEAKEVFRTVLMGLLTAEELSIAADFYSSEVGIKIHHAIIDGESAVSEYLDN